MYDVYARNWAPCQLLRGHVYRVDSRPPAIVNVEGFSGTLTQSHLFPVFEQHTVFTSLTIEGANIFQNIARMKGLDLRYTYQINVTGMRGYVFRSRHLGPQHRLNCQGLAHVWLERRDKQHGDPGRYQRPGYSRLIDNMTGKLTDRIGRSFVNVNEVHIQGPISPERIQFYGSYTAEDRLSQAGMEPRTRRNSI